MLLAQAHDQSIKAVYKIVLAHHFTTYSNKYAQSSSDSSETGIL